MRVHARSPGRNRSCLIARISCLGFVLGFLCGNAWPIHISPTFQIYELEAGQSTWGEATITNDEGQPIKVTAEVRDWYVSKENKNYSVKDWIQFKDPELMLGVGESKTVRFKLKAPTHAKGELIAMASYLVEEEVQSNVRKKMSVAIYLSIKGTEKIDSSLEAIAIMQMDNGIKTGVVIKNKGNVHIRPLGEFNILTSKNEPVAFVFIKRSQATFPGESQEYFGELKDVRLKPGRYKAEISLRDADRSVELIKAKKEFMVTEEMEIKVN